MPAKSPAGGGYRKRRRLRWRAIGIAVLGGVACLFVLLPNRDPPAEVFRNVPAVGVKTPIKAPLSREERNVAARFVMTAVARKHLGEAWALSGPNIRGGLTRAEFLTGNNGVIPYPVGQQEIVPYRIDYSYTDSALVEIALQPRTGSGVRAKEFFLGLEKVGTGAAAHWLVNDWAVVRR